MKALFGPAILLCVLLFVSANAVAQSVPYYITDGDSSQMYIVQNGVLQNTVTTFSGAYAPSIITTVRLKHVADGEAREYTLAGAPTGNSWSGSGTHAEHGFRRRPDRK